LFSIPLRRAFIVQSALKFPEGVATGEVLKAGDGASKEGAKQLMIGGILSSLYKIAQSGLMVVSEGFGYFTHVGKTVVGISTGFSAVLVGAGYIVGAQATIAITVGGVIAWFMAVPLYGLFFGVPEGDAHSAAVTIWNSHIRMIGVGTMVVGGFWTIISLIKPMRDAVYASLETLKKIRLGLGDTIARTDVDIPINYVAIGLLLLIVPMFLVYHHVLSGDAMPMSPVMHYSTVALATVFTLIVGVLCAAVAAYMAGLIGSSQTPISGVTLMAVLSVSLLLFAMLRSEINFSQDLVSAKAIGAFVIILGSVIAIGAALSSDNLQDLKSGQIVGSTPWKQQMMLIVGVIGSAFIMGPVLQVMFEAYGIGDIMPRDGMDPSKTLGAPKAAIMYAVASGIFSSTFKWPMFLIGAALGLVVVFLDEMLIRSKSAFRLPSLGIALGIYMPLDICLPLLIGGLIHVWMRKKLKEENKSSEHVERQYNKGVLFCSGLIAGEALVGILLAIPFSIAQSSDVFALHLEGFEPVATFIGAVSFFGLCYYLYKITTKTA
jgi:putative OPT family oligopeptide transporter